uniref:Uncharacterized protein n=1 Tax=Arundo donax TaxID=35708 RepID=A0A0A9DYI3_ARUDO
MWPLRLLLLKSSKLCNSCNLPISGGIGPDR